MGTTTASRQAAAPASAPLVDPQGRAIDYLRVSVTDRCNYQCTYCIPEDGVAHTARADILSFEEIARVVRCFTAVGVRRIRLTGGEPTVRRDLPQLVAMLRQNPRVEELALSTNGHLLPQLAGPLRRAGVDRLNISLDSLDEQRFTRITRGGNLARVLAGIDAACAAGYLAIKINTVAVRGFNDGELGDLCRYSWARGLIPRFIEQMPMAGGALFVPGTLMSAAEIRAVIVASFPESRLVPEAAWRGQGAGPARYWRLQGGRVAETLGTTALGASPMRQPEPPRVGIISPMTEHFCDTCNRLRLSASGALHTCLGHDDATELRPALLEKGEDGVLAAIRGAVAAKRQGHNFGLIGLGGPRKAMVHIGG